MKTLPDKDGLDESSGYSTITQVLIRTLSLPRDVGTHENTKSSETIPVVSSLQPRETQKRVLGRVFLRQKPKWMDSEQLTGCKASFCILKCLLVETDCYSNHSEKWLIIALERGWEYVCIYFNRMIQYPGISSPGFPTSWVLFHDSASWRVWNQWLVASKARAHSRTEDPMWKERNRSSPNFLGKLVHVGNRECNWDLKQLGTLSESTAYGNRELLPWRLCVFTGWGR